MEYCIAITGDQVNYFCYTQRYLQCMQVKMYGDNLSEI